MIKIETIDKSQANLTVKYSGGIRVTYSNCVAEVDKAEGEYLLATYPTMIFPEGKAIRPKPAEPVVKAPTGEVTDLKEALQKANHLINDYKAQANAAKEGERVWRQKCQDLMFENHTLQDQVKALQGSDTKAGDDVKKADAKPAGTPEALRTALEAKTIKELIVIAEELKLDKAEYQKLTRVKLVEYIIAKSDVK
jgi:hypothetical protein